MGDRRRSLSGTPNSRGVIYAGDMSRGLDFYKLADPELLLKLKLKTKPLKLK